MALTGDELAAKLSKLLTQDAFSVSHSDNPNTPISQALFDGSNYIQWSRQMRLGLGTKEKLGFVDSGIKAPNSSTNEYQRWLRCDRLVGGWILASMSPEIAASFMYTTSAKDLWDEVHERYAQSNGSLLYQLKQEAMRVVQGGLTVTAYFNKLRKIWDDISVLNAIPECTCGNLAKCSCKILQKIQELDSQDKLLHFLINLNSEFDGTKNQIVATNPMPSLNVAYQLVLQVEKQRPSSIPPPPIPPLLKMGSSLKGPPPPSPPLDLATLGKDGAPLPKLKPLRWDKVRATPVWDKLRSSSFEFDEEMIESLFGYNLKNVFQNDEGKSKTPSPNKHVLEPKRLQNMTILLKALNVSVEQVCEALVQGEGLRLQQLEALAKMEPTKEEETKLSNYKGNVNELGSAEKLVKAMLNIPFAFQRIEALLYRATFEDEVVHLRNSFSMLEEACKELRSSRLFLKLLEAVLKTGNRMNVGTIRGGAKAFKLDTLLKLADVKGTDGKTTLLHFVVQEIIRAEGIRMADSIMGKINRNSNKTRTMEEKEEDYKKMGLDLVCGLTTELCNVKKTASIDLDVMANLSKQMTKLRNLLTKELSKDGDSSGFVGAMKTFISHGGTSLRDLQEHEARVLRSVKEITEYFHGEVGKDESNLLCIFVIVRDFLGMLDQVCRELRSLKSPNTLAPFH